MVTVSRTTATEPKIIQWLLDTRPLWPVSPQTKPKEQVGKLKTVARSLPNILFLLSTPSANQNQASRALSLLSPTEQASVLRYYHLKDAKMSLASHLLKRLIISNYAPTSWSQSNVSRDTHGKPCYLPRTASEPRMDFNVSHQAGIVTLIAVVGVDGEDKIEVGTDVVCWDERLVQDYANIDKEGFFKWVDMHADVFAESELSYMRLASVDINMAPKGSIDGGYGKDKVSRCQWRNETLKITVPLGDGDGTIGVLSNEIIDKKLRRFYACWCLREAYVKMTGEALMAPWLKELEISDVKAPAVSKMIEDEKALEEGETERHFTINFKGKPVTNVLMELVAFGKGYMVGSAIRPVDKVKELHLELGKWKHLDLEKDVLYFAESNP